ncbi:MAG TPA: HAD family phosphatase [bacterium]|nr:HAD family phosphatase [bacterium]HQL62005.1 HAD family phosphatase [bacterium]
MTAIRALIFDFNGVILNDEPIHNENLQSVFAEKGIFLSLEEIRHRCHGRGDYECFSMLLRENTREPTPALLEAMIARKSRYYRQRIDREVPLVPGMREFLERCHGRYPSALASGALPSEIRYVLDRLGLNRFFAVTANTCEVNFPKPNPAVYLLALERLRAGCAPDLAPEQCLVFEDSPVGLQAALSAGMGCIGVATSTDARELAGATMVIADFLDPRLFRL